MSGSPFGEIRFGRLASSTGGASAGAGGAVGTAVLPLVAHHRRDVRPFEGARSRRAARWAVNPLKWSNGIHVVELLADRYGDGFS